MSSKYKAHGNRIVAKAFPNVILRDRMLPARALSLPVTTRLPHDTVSVVKAFYDFHFDSWAAPGERRIVLETTGAKRGATGVRWTR